MGKRKGYSLNVQCLGRDAGRNPVLSKPVTATVHIGRLGDSIITLNVSCVHNTGGHGQRCKASHPPGVNKVGEGVFCPYSADIPYALDGK